MVRWEAFVQSSFANSAEWSVVQRIAVQLENFLNEKSVAERISVANRPGASSLAIEGIVAEKALSLGFSKDSKHLFSHIPPKNLRPDFYLCIGSSGILLEVERGKTIQNNMDLLDFWKCHLAHSAHYLILLVPLELKQNEGTKSSKPFTAVLQRLGAFFIEGNYTNVRGTIIIGY